MKLIQKIKQHAPKIILFIVALIAFTLMLLVHSFFNHKDVSATDILIQEYNQSRETRKLNRKKIELMEDKIAEFEQINEDQRIKEKQLQCEILPSNENCFQKAPEDKTPEHIAFECAFNPECIGEVGTTRLHDFRTDGWRVNSHGKSKDRLTLCATDADFWHGVDGPECNMQSILELNNLPYQPFVDGERKHLIKKELTFCIAWADSDLGRQLKSANNIGNVGNNDRGDTVGYTTIEDGIDAMYRVLNGTYLKHKQSIGSLSPGGGGDTPFYATSPENWNNNVLNCLNTVLDPSINEDWHFRIDNK